MIAKVSVLTNHILASELQTVREGKCFPVEISKTREKPSIVKNRC